MLELVLQGQNLDSDLGWLDLVTTAIRVAPLFKMLLLKNMVFRVVSSDVWCAYGYCCSLWIADQITLSFLRMCKALALYDIAIC